MRVLVLGGTGMLGARLVRDLGIQHDVMAASRSGTGHYRLTDLSRGTIERLLEETRPECVINAIGLIKQKDHSDHEALWEVNADFPHRLADATVAAGIRMIHFSTDCVFSGQQGGYTELDRPDPVDEYGRSKLAGEVSGPEILTLRTSFIGLEQTGHASLVEWFLRQSGSIRGFSKAIFSGLTTAEVSRVVLRVLAAPSRANGMFHLSAQPISKHALLIMLRDRLKLSTEIVPDDSLVCDRSLVSLPFRMRFAYQPPSWSSMIDELAVEVRGRVR